MSVALDPGGARLDTPPLTRIGVSAGELSDLIDRFEVEGVVLGSHRHPGASVRFAVADHLRDELALHAEANASPWREAWGCAGAVLSFVALLLILVVTVAATCLPVAGHQ